MYQLILAFGSSLLSHEQGGKEKEVLTTTKGEKDSDGLTTKMIRKFFVHVRF